MNMSFQEKSTWASFALTLSLFGIYFTKAFLVFKDPGIPDSTLITLFIQYCLAFIFVQILAHIVIAVTNIKEANQGGDERDKMIIFKARRISHAVITLGMGLTIYSTFRVDSLFLVANIGLFFALLSEIVNYGVQLYYYRRGL